jgi:acetyl esterase
MPLDPQARIVWDTLAASGVPPTHLLSVAEARQAMFDILPLGSPLEPVAWVEDRQVPSSIPGAAIPVRIYAPEGTGPFPVLVFFHGGGWVVGNLEIYDAICRTLTNSAGCITVSVDYRLAPEHKFPDAAEDCYEATRWVVENGATFNGDPGRVAVGGDSAGGNLATVVALMARDRGGPPLIFQVLIYPVTDHYTAGHASYEENAEGYFLSRDEMIWFWNHYLLGEEEAEHPYASPLKAVDLHGLPPALVITAEFDPLRDEGEMYATRLREAGVPVIATRYDGMMHGFINMSGVLDQSKRAFSQITAELHKAFNHAV